MDHGSSGATALLGMDGFVVLASIEESGNSSSQSRPPLESWGVQPAGFDLLDTVD